MRRGIALLVLGACSFRAGSVSGPQDSPEPSDKPVDAPARIRAGLLVFYGFREGGGSIVDDTSGVIPPVQLAIADPTKVTWQTHGLTIDAAVAIASPSSTRCRISTSCRASGGVTVEAWASPLRPDVTGSAGQFARVVTMAVNAGARNFALGQQGTSWAAQIRTATPAVDIQGSPILAGGAVVTTTTHLALTTDATTRALYVNGELVASDGLGGPLSTWNDGYRFAVGAEPTNNNWWNGTLLMIAVYDHSLTAEEIANNFRLGPEAE